MLMINLTIWLTQDAMLLQPGEKQLFNRDGGLNRGILQAASSTEPAQLFSPICQPFAVAFDQIVFTGDFNGSFCFRIEQLKIAS